MIVILLKAFQAGKIKLITVMCLPLQTYVRGTNVCTRTFITASETSEVCSVRYVEGHYASFIDVCCRADCRQEIP